jgi:hypothetical protein
MNGCNFQVLRNLFDFLELLVTNEHESDPEMSAMAREFYWIDALCIDQTNNSERNHQVGQIGEIFARANLVHIWLGKKSYPEAIRHLLLGPAGSGDVDQYVDEHEVELWKIRAEERIYFLNIDLFKNEYWDRAWVTQEIVLARCIVASLGNELFNYSDLFYHTTYMPELRIDNPFYQFEYINQKQSTELRGSSLLYLLRHFRNKKCSVPRDRVHSLLSLCDESHKLDVDYETPTAELAYQLLECYRDCMCLCAAIIVAEALHVRYKPFGKPDDLHFAGLYLEIEIQGFEIEKRWIPRGMEWKWPHPHWCPPGLGEYCFVPPPAASFSKCLLYWLRRFIEVLNSNVLLGAYINNGIAVIVPFAKFSLGGLPPGSDGGD